MEYLIKCLWPMAVDHWRYWEQIIPNTALNTQGSRRLDENEPAGTQLCMQRGSPERAGKEEAARTAAWEREGTRLHKAGLRYPLSPSASRTLRIPPVFTL